MGDLFGILLTVVLLAGNAFFVAAEFALISARRDRLEALVAQGKKKAQTVIEAGENLSIMLAAAQLGITICSILLGRVGEPAIAHLIERPFELLGLPDQLLHPVGFALALTVVVILHILLGEMVPKNIAIAGPERTAIWLVPPFLVFTTAMRPLINLFNFIANGVLRLIGVEPRDELEAAFTSGELADLIAESGREGLLDDQESSRLTRTLHSVEATVADVLVPLLDLVALPARPTVGDVAEVVARTGFSRFPLRGPDRRFTGYLHVKDILDLIDDPAAVVPPQRIRALPEVAVDARLDDALAVLRRPGAHLGRAVDRGGHTVGLIALEDLIEHLVGTVRDGTHARPERTGVAPVAPRTDPS